MVGTSKNYSVEILKVAAFDVGLNSEAYQTSILPQAQFIKSHVTYLALFEWTHILGFVKWNFWESKIKRKSSENSMIDPGEPCDTCRKDAMSLDTLHLVHICHLLNIHGLQNICQLVRKFLFFWSLFVSMHENTLAAGP